jgi:hypothetical protein
MEMEEVLGGLVGMVMGRMLVDRLKQWISVFLGSNSKLGGSRPNLKQRWR